MNKKLLIIIIAVVIVIILAFLLLNHHGDKPSKLPETQTTTVILNTTTSPTTTIHLVYTNSTTVKTTSYTTSVSLVLRNDTYFLDIQGNKIPAKAYLYYLSDNLSLFGVFNITSNATLLPLIEHNGLPFPPGRYTLVVNGTGLTLNFNFTLNVYTGDIIYTNGSYSMIVLPQPPLKIIINNTTYLLSNASGTYNGVILVKGYIPPTTSIEIYNGVQWIKVEVVYIPHMVYLPYSEVFEKSS
ncbi:hypothetical protein [Stygiolobus azoricus]|uniref:Uncharacterized protein n=1 Tax=Stygiolobus azoricus TaxID=41675 RepID=A0A650CPF5_9CREN|nr:hypothetical protein [Stygiolobus azoricus]QGR19721.1 hypothetical protein D1868_06745 [Stygiolobus azoricus]